MTAKQQAAVIAGSVLAALQIAHERGELILANLERIARTAANNAAMQLDLEARLNASETPNQ